MKYQNSRPLQDEREKLRKFRELDDAFAEALRELDEPAASQNAVSGEAQQTMTLADEQTLQEQREALFRDRLRTLMQEYALHDDSVSELLSTLRTLGRIA